MKTLPFKHHKSLSQKLSLQLFIVKFIYDPKNVSDSPKIYNETDFLVLFIKERNGERRKPAFQFMEVSCAKRRERFGLLHTCVEI